MKTQNRQLISALGLSSMGLVVMLALGLALGRWQKPGNVEAVVPEGPRVSSNAMVKAENSVLSENPRTIHVATIEGIEVSASNTLWSNGQLTTDVCFTIPDDNPDWIITSASLTTANKTISDWSTTPLEIRFPPLEGQQQVTTYTAEGNPINQVEKAGIDAKGLRCDRFSFDVADKPTEPVAFSVNKLTARPTEGKYCEHLMKVQAQLKARNLNFTIDCTEGNGLTNVVVSSKPETLSQTDAEKLVFSDEWYSHTGQWALILEVGQ